ncbi:MAG TPA: alpha/beta hydrolase family protein [Longimicrobiales bacterium]
MRLSVMTAAAVLLCAPALSAQARPRATKAPAAAAATAPTPAPGPLFPSTDPRVRVVSIPGTVPAPRNAAVLLPADYETSGRRYPVLYLLHGLGGAYDNWLTRTNVAEYTASLPLIVVMPDGGDSWYANSVTDTVQKFQHYIAQDVVGYIDAHFRTLPFAAGRYIAGLSMGGYGAVMLATTFPNRWSLAASFSGAVGLAKDADSPSTNAAFGPPNGPARDSADLPALLRRVDPKGLPYFYLDCGTGDRLIQGNRDVSAILAERAIPYEYHETRGVHDWEYWNRRVPVVLQLVAQRIQLLGR